MFDITGALKTVGGIIDDVWTSDEEKRELIIKEQALKLEDKKIDNQLLISQQEINKFEAQHKSVFVAGWRPFIGWIGGFSLAYKFIVYPLLGWVWTTVDIFVKIPDELKMPPNINASDLYPIIMGMLGIGAMRSYDKTKNNVTNIIKPIKQKVIENKRGFLSRLFKK